MENHLEHLLNFPLRKSQYLNAQDSLKDGLVLAGEWDG